MGLARVTKSVRCSGIMRSSNGQFLYAYSSFHGEHTCMYTEAMAVLEGVLYAWEHQWLNLWIELDSLVLVDILKGSIAVPWNLRYIIHYTKRMLRPFQSIISHIYREGNMAADHMAIGGLIRKEPKSFTFLNRCQGVLGCTEVDMVGLPNIRHR